MMDKNSSIKTLTRAFLALLGLSASTALLADRVPQSGALFVVAVLILSGLKARVILMHYLGLAQAPSFRGGFTAFLIAFLALAFGLYLVGEGLR